eukprot:TRINITY_DN8817_c5_g1_i1.p1 TRINITY_DN8817_c5_g1~~TRINITY_DN8817_c5_g1_i1.p1  ORF type:complete len:766 (+),score=171.90 TRINITY_DN8817_c5_g1_i1:47-2344(+)
MPITRTAIAVLLMAAATGADQTAAVEGLIDRLLPGMGADFTLQLVDKTACGEGKSLCFGYSAQGGKVALTGTSGVELSMALNHYLKYVTNSSISWKGTGGNQLSLSAPLPDTPLVHVNRAHDLHYYANVCTFSYSFVWYTFSDWVREIDWMALNGVNLPLAYTGQEKVYQKVYNQMGVTDEELAGFFPGPAFLAWGRGQNLLAWGGPLPQEWIDSQWELQRQILPLMREFGMKPVLPAFQGNVPNAFVTLFPAANVSRVGTCPTPLSKKYGCMAWMDAMDPLFNKTADLVMKTVIADFGTDHYYAADGDFTTAMAPWYANDKLSETKLPEPLENGALPTMDMEAFNHSRAAYNGMIRTDPDAKWVYQTWSWLFGTKQSYMYGWVSAVPKGNLILLDLMAEETPMWKATQSYYGSTFIWCMLHDFGGNNGMWGDALSVSRNPVTAAVNSTMVGTGLTMEGINQNAMIYELMNEMAYRTTSPDLPTWAARYAQRRYAEQSPSLNKAWTILMNTVYNFPGYNIFVSKDAYTAIPYSSPWDRLQPTIWYNQSEFVNAWGLMLEGTQNGLTYRHDLVDVTRQALGKYSSAVWKKMNVSIVAGDAQGIQEGCDEMVDVLNDAEKILNTVETFMMGEWVQAARQCGNGDAKMTALMNFNAVEQVTLWGYTFPAADDPNGPDVNLPGLVDYATKQWAGLMSAYHAKKWTIFTSHKIASILNHSAFNQTAFHEDLISWYHQWRDTAVFSTIPVGDTHEISSELYAKYSPHINEA